MKNNYVIIDADILKERIADFQQKSRKEPDHELSHIYGHIANELIYQLSQSKPLQPILEKTFDNGALAGIATMASGGEMETEKAKSDYLNSFEIK